MYFVKHIFLDSRRRFVIPADEMTDVALVKKSGLFYSAAMSRTRA